MALWHVRLSAVSRDAKGRTNGPARTLRDPDGGDEFVMDVPEVKSIMRDHFAGLAAEPNPQATSLADWDRVAYPGGRPVHHPPLSGLMEVLTRMWKKSPEAGDLGAPT
jgi:hypothetical protein